MAGQSSKRQIALAFQGGVIPAGTFAAGVVKALVDNRAFEKYDIVAFSGTSSGALVASLCWGHLLEDTMDKAPDALRKMWLDIAYGTFPDATQAQSYTLFNQFASVFPAYDILNQTVLVPFVREKFERWVNENLRFEAWQTLFEKKKTAIHTTAGPLYKPGLLMGATDVLEGDIKVFKVCTAEDFRLQTVLACGSIEETNGLTVIKEGPHEGIYMDGAWAINPPISDLIDYRVDEIWLVQVFPKRRAQLPAKPAERKDRRDELWQTSLIEHELKMINFVNKWRDALNAAIVKEDKTIADENQTIAKEDKTYRLVKLETIPMERDLPWGATIINTKSFMTDMMDYGYHQGHRLMEKKDAENS